MCVLWQSLVREDERMEVKLVWEAGVDDWDSYIFAHMQAIRAKYFPKNANDQVDHQRSQMGVF